MARCLEIAVPGWIEKLKNKSFADFEARRDAILNSVCYKGDLLLYGSPRKGETAKLFNDLAEGLAWLALIAKGGVTFGEQHWDAEFEAVPIVPDADQGALQSEEMQGMREESSEAPSGAVEPASGGDGA